MTSDEQDKRSSQPLFIQSQLLAEEHFSGIRFGVISHLREPCHSERFLETTNTKGIYRYFIGEHKALQSFGEYIKLV